MTVNDSVSYQLPSLLFSLAVTFFFCASNIASIVSHRNFFLKRERIKIKNRFDSFIIYFYKYKKIACDHPLAAALLFFLSDDDMASRFVRPFTQPKFCLYSTASSRLKLAILFLSRLKIGFFVCLNSTVVFEC